MTHKQGDIGEELREIAPALETLGAHPDFEVPVRYFDAFPERLMARIRAIENGEAVTEELETLSPLLAGVSRKTPFAVPDGYFKDLTEKVVTGKTQATGGRVVQMGRRIRLFKRCLAAACIAGLVAVGAVLLSQSLNNNAIERMMARISDQEIEDYLMYNTDAFDEENIFANVSLEEGLPSVLPEGLSAKEIDNLLEDNLLHDVPINQ